MNTTKPCPSNHWNDGDDVCADCGADLNAPGRHTPDLLAALVDIIGLADEAVTAREHSDDPDDASTVVALRQSVTDAYAAIAKAKGGEA